MRKHLLKDSATYLAGSIIVQAMGFTGLILLMNYLPVEQYGKYIYIIEFISIFALVPAEELEARMIASSPPPLPFTVNLPAPVNA